MGFFGRGGGGGGQQIKCSEKKRITDHESDILTGNKASRIE